MSTVRQFMSWTLSLSLLLLTTAAGTRAQQPAGAAPAIAKVMIATPSEQPEVGKKIQFVATAMDAAGKPLPDIKPSAWFAVPFDLASADEKGVVSFYNPGQVRVGAIVGGKLAFLTVNVKPPLATRIEIAPVSTPLVVGGQTRLSATARAASGNPISNAAIAWTSDNANVATVDPAGVVIGMSPGTATLRAMSDGANATVAVNVVKSDAASITVEPRTAQGAHRRRRAL